MSALLHLQLSGDLNGRMIELENLPPAIDMKTPNPLVVLPLSASTMSDDFPACDNAMTYDIQPRRIDSVKAWLLVRC
jgi:hypothetical protein